MKHQTNLLLLLRRIKHKNIVLMQYLRIKEHIYLALCINLLFFLSHKQMALSTYFCLFLCIRLLTVHPVKNTI